MPAPPATFTNRIEMLRNRGSSQLAHVGQLAAARAAQQRRLQASISQIRGRGGASGISLGGAISPGDSDQGQGIGGQAVKEAMKYLGMPYQWGGSNPRTSFDCSGLIQYVYGRLGVKLPRVSNQQARAGRAVGRGQARPGDLIWWDNSSRNVGADHIGIYIGNGQYLDAPSRGRTIGIRNLGNRAANFTRVT